MQIPATTSGISGGSPLSVPKNGSMASSSAPGVSFEQLMTRLLHDADQPQQAVTNDMNQLLAGNVNNIHDVAINVAKADVAFRLVMEVRDKLISAYQDVMRMQV